MAVAFPTPKRFVQVNSGRGTCPDRVDVGNEDGSRRVALVDGTRMKLWWRVATKAMRGADANACRTAGQRDSELPGTGKRYGRREWQTPRLWHSRHAVI